MFLYPVILFFDRHSFDECSTTSACRYAAVLSVTAVTRIIHEVSFLKRCPVAGSACAGERVRYLEACCRCIVECAYRIVQVYILRAVIAFIIAFTVVSYLILRATQSAAAESPDFTVSAYVYACAALMILTCSLIA